MSAIVSGGQYVDVPDGNNGITLQASTTAVANGNTADLLNFRFSGGIFFFNVSALAGTSPTITFFIEGKDPASGGYVTLLSGPAISAVGLTTLTVYPQGISTANAMAANLLPRTFRIRWVLGGTGPNVTLSVGASLN